MVLNRAVPILLAILLILVFAYVALGTIYSEKCPWAICNSVAFSNHGAQAVAIKYFFDGSDYHVLGKISLRSECSSIITNASGGPTDPLAITLTTKELGSCASGAVDRTFYVQTQRDQMVPIEISINGTPAKTESTSVVSQGELSF